MTSIASGAGVFRSVRPRTVAGILGILGLALFGQLLTPEPWNLLWPLLPVAGAAAFLLAQGGTPAVGWLAPLAALGWLALGSASDELWTWCLIAGLCATGMLGLAERWGAEPGRRPWAYLPVLALAILFPFAPNYGEVVERLSALIVASEAREIAHWRSLGLAPDRQVALEQLMATSASVQLGLVRHLLPALLVVWVGGLVHLAERLARRVAELAGKPLPAPPPLSTWRLPEGAIWPLIVGLGLVATRDPLTMLAGTNVAVVSGLAYGIQGLAVIRRLLHAVGVGRWMCGLLFTLLFVTLGPVLAAVAVGVGLMDLWLDFRRLEPRRQGTEPEGGTLWK